MHLVSQDSPAAVSSQFDQFVISGDWIMCRRLQRRCIDQVVPARSAQAGRGASFRQRHGRNAMTTFWLRRAFACVDPSEGVAKAPAFWPPGGLRYMVQRRCHF